MIDGINMSNSSQLYLYNNMKYLLSILGIILLDCLLPAVAEPKLNAVANAAVRPQSL